MIRVTDETREAFKSDVSVKTISISIPDASLSLTNDDIIEDSLELREAINTGDNLNFQGCIASSFKFSCFNLVDETLVGKYIECSIQADNTDVISLFKGYISEITNPTHEEFVTEIRAYDALYNICNQDVTSWYNSLSFPLSCLSLRNSFFNYVGVTQKADSLVNDGMSIQKTLTDKVITGDKIIKAICQVNGRYGRIGRNGQFEYVHLVEGIEALYPAEDLYPSDDLYPKAENALESVAKAYYTDIKFENYKTTAITKVQIVDKEGQIAATAGTGTNIFTLKDNFLVWGISNLASVANNLFNEIRGLWYIPASIKCVGLPYVECGDFVMMSARRSIVRSYVLERTLSGIQILTDSYKANGDQDQPTYIPTVQSQINANSQAITTETERATTAEVTEYNRATTAETRISNLVAENARITNANITNLTAEVASVRSLAASKVTAGEVNAQILNATSAFIDAAECRSIVTNTISANYIQARQITSLEYMNYRGNSIGVVGGYLYRSPIYVTVNGQDYRCWCDGGMSYVNFLGTGGGE